MSESFSLKLFLVFAFIISLFVYLTHLSFTHTSLYSDGKFYFAYTRSVVKDFDLSLESEFKFLEIKPILNKDGLAINTFPIGSSLLWIPGFLLIHLFSPGLSGFEIPYQISVAITSAFLVTLGLYFCYKSLRKFFDINISLITIALLFLGTNLIFYSGVEPINSHSASFFISSLFVYYLLNHLVPAKGWSAS